MHSGNSLSPQHPAVPAVLGFCSIVLEGRSVCDEDGGDEGESSLPAASKLVPDDAHRINQKLQLLSKEYVEKNKVLCVASSSPRTEDDNFESAEKFGSKGLLSSLVSFRNRDAWSPTRSSKAIYSGFETMKPFGNVSPNKSSPRSCINALNLTSMTLPIMTNGGKKIADKTRPKEGPHCQQFLKKIGLIKIDPLDECEHACNIYDKYCYRWQVFLKQLSSILSNGEAICIEVYLGPEKHAILLEQWILTLTNKTTQSLMTLQSLCSAIRSQMYFSQIAAWTDLIKNATKPGSESYDRDIFENPRVVKVSLASASSSSKQRQPKLDIMFRIKAFDNTACFNNKPNIHNFPDAIISENIVIQVCLKSLPRMDKIPKLSDDLDSKSDLVDDRMNLLCTEKGKHRCAFQEDDPEEDSTMHSSADHHRQKQLQKLKKLMKKEKKKKIECGLNCESMKPSHSINIPYPGNYSSSINSIHPPLYSSNEDVLYSTSTTPSSSLAKSTQTAISNFNVNLSSVATQTEELNCCFCSNNSSNNGRTSDIKMQYNNNYNNDNNCDKNYYYRNINVVQSSMDNSREEHVKKGELLLQAIERTAIINSSLMLTNNNNKSSTSSNNSNNNNNNNNNNVINKLSDMSKSECDKFNNIDLGDCRLCKRQKTKHNYNNNNIKNSANNSEEDEEEEEEEEDDCDEVLSSSYRRTMSENFVGIEQNNEEKIDECQANMKSMKTAVKSYRCAFSDDVIETFKIKIGDDDDEDDEAIDLCSCGSSDQKFKTPNSCSTPASNPLFVKCCTDEYSSTASATSPHKKQILSSIKMVPRINLNTIYNISPLARDDSGFLTSNSSLASSSSPIPISSDKFNLFSPVHKSNSAPTFGHSPTSLSPRFFRSTIKQRSRYLSERSSMSERSSIGSDEQFSDEDLSSVYSPSISPTKLTSKTMFNRNLFKFARLPMLGTLEESLFQRRLKPKFQVPDFKVLLGASGAFCPNQLTIPASTYFYELQGHHLTTPYMCELRLPRKGYSIPRTGTVQVTLLNPMGTVVRMFVVPYDFRDMPPMSMTFIRQRILAYDEGSLKTTGKNIEQLSNVEQMKLLRYGIHLRFQTSRSGKLSLHTDIKMLISRRTDCDTAAAHANNLLEQPNELKVVTILPDNPKFSSRNEKI